MIVLLQVVLLHTLNTSLVERASAHVCTRISTTHMPCMVFLHVPLAGKSLLGQGSTKYVPGAAGL